MKLKVLDQLHVSAVSAETLRPGQEIDVHDALGAELLKKHPRVFSALKTKAAKAKVEPDSK
jgi:hypothetical protein